MIRLGTMGWLDRVVGAALCRLMARCLPDNPDARAIQPGTRVLFIGLAEMGSAILADPALRRAREMYGAEPLFAIFHHNRHCLRLTATVQPENVFSLRAGNLGILILDILRFMAWTRRRRVQVVVDMDPCSHFSALLAALSGAGIRAGTAADSAIEGRAGLFNRRVPYRSDRHLAQQIMMLVDAAFGLGHVTDADADADDGDGDGGGLPAVPLSPINAAERRQTQARLQAAAPGFDPVRHRVVLIGPNPGDMLPQRRWSQDRYVGLIGWILDRHKELFIFLMGAGSDQSALQSMAERIEHPRCRTIAGSFSLTELPALFACSDLWLGSDSGPAHFAAVTNLPVIALFGPEVPARYRPLGNATTFHAGLSCSPCINPETFRQSRCRDNRCMSAIGVADVVAEVERRLGERVAPELFLGG